MKTLLKPSEISLHPGSQHQYTRPSLDPRFLLCAVTTKQGLCPKAWKIPVRATPSVRSRTSEAAARSMVVHVKHYRWRVLEAFRVAGQYHVNPAPYPNIGGLTDEEGIEVTGIPSSTYRPRRVELVRDNLVLDSGKTRKTHSGRLATVWVIRE